MVSPSGTRWTFLAIALGLIASGGCERGDGGARALDGPSPFPGAAPGLMQLGAEALEAVAARDTVSLNAVRLTQSEHNDELWPELPASAPELNVPIDFVWENIQVRNRAALERLRPLLEGDDVGVTGVECLGETQEFETFRVHTDCWISFESPRWGEARIQLFEDAVERGGGFKLFRYYDNRPEPERR